jgi:hypothetical protein
MVSQTATDAKPLFANAAKAGPHDELQFLVETAAGQLPLGFEAFYTGVREGMLVGRIDHVLGGATLHQAMSLVQLEVGIRVAKPVALRATSGATGATATSTRTIALATLHRSALW